jgi:hypothetical protein
MNQRIEIPDALFDQIILGKFIRNRRNPLPALKWLGKYFVGGPGTSHEHGCD